MPYIETPDGVPIFYLDEGPRTETALFLLHAEPFNSIFWQRNVPELSSKTRVVAMDVRGRGQSGKTDEGHNFAQYSRDFSHVLDVLGLARIVPAGWSFGASIVWEYIQQFGEDRLAGYVNVDQQPYRYVSEEDFKRLLGELTSRRLRFHKRRILSYLGPESREASEVVDWMAYECLKTPTAAHISLMTDSYYADYRPFLGNTTVPSCTFWAKYGLIDAQMVQEIDRATPNSRLVFFEHSGHLLPWTEAEKFNRELEAFVLEVLPS